VLESGEYEQGPEIDALEAEFSQYVGRAHAVTVGSCYDAMHRSLVALGIGPGNEVITVANTDIACTAAIRRTGADVVFADIDERTHSVAPEDLETRITPRTRAVLVVHMYGHPADMDRIGEIAERRALLVIEDAALAVGATLHGRSVGTFGHVGCFSHAPSKILGNAGDGGTIVTDDAELADAARHMFLYWQMRGSRTFAHGAKLHAGFHLIEEGTRGRMVELSAAILRVKLGHLERWIEAQRRIADAYRERLTETDVILPVEVGDVRHAYRNFAVRVPERRDTVRATGRSRRRDRHALRAAAPSPAGLRGAGPS